MFRLYAKDAPDGPQRMIAEVPTSEPLTVGVRSELQVFARPPPKGQTLVVETTSAQRTVRAQLSGTDERAELTAVGSAFAAGSLGPGEARVCAMLSRDGEGAASRTCAVFTVTP
jgi:hypothetical protein